MAKILHAFPEFSAVTIESECAQCQAAIASDTPPTPPHFNCFYEYCGGAVGHSASHCTAGSCY